MKPEVEKFLKPLICKTQLQKIKALNPKIKARFCFEGDHAKLFFNGCKLEVWELKVDKQRFNVYLYIRTAKGGYRRDGVTYGGTFEKVKEKASELIQRALEHKSIPQIKWAKKDPILRLIQAARDGHNYRYTLKSKQLNMAWGIAVTIEVGEEGIEVKVESIAQAGYDLRGSKDRRGRTAREAIVSAYRILDKLNQIDLLVKNPEQEFAMIRFQ